MLPNFPREVLSHIPASIRKLLIQNQLEEVLLKSVQDLHSSTLTFDFISYILKKCGDNVHACVLLKKVVFPQNLLLVLPQLEAHLVVIGQ